MCTSVTGLDVFLRITYYIYVHIRTGLFNWAKISIIIEKPHLCLNFLIQTCPMFQKLLFSFHKKLSIAFSHFQQTIWKLYKCIFRNLDIVKKLPETLTESRPDIHIEMKIYGQYYKIQEVWSLYVFAMNAYLVNREQQSIMIKSSFPRCNQPDAASLLPSSYKLVNPPYMYTFIRVGPHKSRRFTISMHIYTVPVKKRHNETCWWWISSQ